MREYNCELVGKVISVEENPEGIEFYLSVNRPSDMTDILPVIASREVLGDINIEQDMTVRVFGVIRTIRFKNSYRSRLRVDSISLELAEGEEHKNKVFGRFEVKASRTMRVTKSGYKIKDIILRKNISEEKGYSEFRAVLWNDNAEQYNKVADGTELYIVGRLQSREYLKKNDEGTNKVKTYEVSVGKVENDTDQYAEDIG